MASKIGAYFRTTLQSFLIRERHPSIATQCWDRCAFPEGELRQSQPSDVCSPSYVAGRRPLARGNLPAELYGRCLGKLGSLDVYCTAVIPLCRRDPIRQPNFSRRMCEMAEKYIVSDDRKFIYFVVQKVACSSIKTALLPLFDVSTNGFRTTRNDGTTGLRIHRLFDRSDYQIRRTQLIAELHDHYDNYFKFAFVRNPWDRLVSCYCQKLNPNGPGLKLPVDNDIELYPGMSFPAFVEAVHAIPDGEANPHF